MVAQTLRTVIAVVYFGGGCSASGHGLAGVSP